MKKKDEFLKLIKKISREEQLETENRFGKLHSKTWGGKLSHKELRRKEKIHLQELVKNGKLSETEE